MKKNEGQENVLRLKHILVKSVRKCKWCKPQALIRGNHLRLGVLKMWDKNIGDKPCANWEFLIPLESFWNVNIENELAFSIWKFEV
jgi:hypothetical protein